MNDAIAPPIAIGVFGVSGVGKSTMIRQFVRDKLEYTHAIASELIRSGLGDQLVTPESLREAGTDKIGLNQEALVVNFMQLRSSLPNSTILLDAHSVIDTDSGFVMISSEVISALNLRHLIFIRGTPRVIHQHRQVDQGRNRPERQEIQLSLYQEIALDQCQLYAASLRLPLNLISAEDNLGFAIAVALAIRTNRGCPG